MKLNFFNTLTKQAEEFIPIEPMKVKMYTCGPTVYNFAHIGNLRTYIFEDILKRVLEYNNYEVKHVMNITDVGHLQSDADDGEDKMELGAKRESKSVLEIARFYEDAFIKDLEKLNIILPNEIPRATEHIKSIINLIKTLEEKGYTYIANNNVYFSIDKFDNYSKLANLSIQELQAGNRVDVDEFKKNPLDFVLWFGNSKYENHILKWDSPWGVGFPGWHIECSAMAIEYLGEHLDIHCGGIDHVPVHHTNEIAQSEGALGHKWVNYWMHGEFLVVDNGKMSKSSGDFLTLNKLIENKFDPLVYRYYVLQSKYRKPLDFSYENLSEASKSLISLKNKIQTILDNIDASSQINEFILKDYTHKFKKQINDDLNISNGFTVLFDVIKSNNLNNLEKKILIDNFDLVFGLKLINNNRLTLNQDKINWIENLLNIRNEYRKNKNWKKSDEIRTILLNEHIEILDTKGGTKWRLFN
ncbi:MAG: cysteine--tRNA ligase [Paraclostridium sp.]|uniref:cysteine--tRNA ligase n=1 Tax=Paraclostridium sp. TaxID=2023273 RepID=UPI003F3B4B6D